MGRRVREMGAQGLISDCVAVLSAASASVSGHPPSASEPFRPHPQSSSPSGALSVPPRAALTLARLE
eukprot:5634247-Pyramimonas_sp.AAC.1